MTAPLQSALPVLANAGHPAAVSFAHGSNERTPGGQLVEQGLRTCRKAGYKVAVVLGHPSYYPKFGFVLARTHGIHWEHEVPGDPFMVMELQAGALAGVRGTVRYLPEFVSL